MGKLACIFPGQGSQTVGMGLDLYNTHASAKSMFEKIDELAGRKLSTLCFEGPESELKRTVNTQPTILAASLAAWSAYNELGGPKPDFVAGHSLGEMTALVACESLSLEDAIALVKRRAHLMENCAVGAMSAVLGVADEKLEACCREATELLLADGVPEAESVVVVANFNTKDQLVISGSPQAVVKAGELAKAAGGKVIPLPVGGAFHSPLMVPAAEEFACSLEHTRIREPRLTIIQNFDAKPSAAHHEVRHKLALQMNSAVRWSASVEYMLAQGVDTFVEIGPGKVLIGTVKKIDKNAKMFNICDAQSLQATIDGLKQLVTT